MSGSSRRCVAAGRAARSLRATFFERGCPGPQVALPQEARGCFQIDDILGHHRARRHRTGDGDAPARPAFGIDELLGLRIVPQNRVAHALGGSPAYIEVALDIEEAEAQPRPLHGKGQLQDTVGDFVAHAGSSGRGRSQ